MSSTTTPVIGLFKPVPGTAEPFRVSDLNDNMDLLDAAYGTIEPKLEEINTAVTEVDAALVEVEAAVVAANAATAALDTEAIILAIESNALDIDGGTA